MRFIMRVLQLSFASAFDALKGNLFRTTLTIAGLAIGVASVMLISAIGTGLSSVVKDQLERFDPSLLIITASETEQSGRSAFFLRSRDAKLIASVTPNVTSAGAELRRPVRASYAGYSHRTNISGMDATMIQLRETEVEKGRIFSDSDHRGAARVVLIGATVTQELFENDDPMGKIVQINGTPMEVVGLLKEQGAGVGGDADNVIITPLRTTQKKVLGSRVGRPFDEVSSLWVTFSTAQFDSNKESISQVLSRRAGTRATANTPFELRSMEDQLAQVQDAVAVVRVGMSLIGSIAVFVAGIGILNTMLASIGERTREIGIRRAIGASRVDIRNQFLLEALCISTTGGIVGILIALFGIVFARFQFPDWPLIIDTTSVVGVTIIAMVTGH